MMIIASVLLIIFLSPCYAPEISGCYYTSFPCRGLGILTYPFFTGTTNECGVFEVDCIHGKIKLQSQWYDFLDINYAGHIAYRHEYGLYGTKYRDGYSTDSDRNMFKIRDNTLQERIQSQSCDSFKNITIKLPTSPIISTEITTSTATFVRCTGKISKVTAEYFGGYYNYSGCPGYSLYYTYAYGFLPTILPQNCSFIEVPVSFPAEQNYADDSDPFKIITADLEVRWDISTECTDCNRHGGKCSTNNAQKIECVGGYYWKQGTRAIPPRPSRPLTKVLIGVSSAVILIALAGILFLYFKRDIVMIWRKRADLYHAIRAFFRKSYRYSGIAKMVKKWRQKPKSHRRVKLFLKNYDSLAPKRYKYSDIKMITNSFRDKLGEGGFGSVYKGKLFNGNLVAVKVLKESKGDGEEFFNEVASISRTSHVNVVTLLGFCLNGRNRALIYEFMPNGSLEKFVYNKISSINHQLGWDIYYKIAVGIARGLEYLHRGCNTRILHFDIKPHNILLNEDFVPKISDFGLAKLCPGKESVVSMMNPRGTIGYIAPEVVSKEFGRISHKSDVYSYGMMVLEMVGWRKNIEIQASGDASEIYFPDWIYKRLESDQEVGTNEIMNGDENVYERKMIIVSLWCIQSDPSCRPSMSRVVEMLEGNSESLQIPPKSVLSSPSSSPPTHFSSTIDIN